MAGVPIEHNNWWFNFYNPGTYTYEIVRILEDEQRALSGEEIAQKLKERLKKV